MLGIRERTFAHLAKQSFALTREGLFALFSLSCQQDVHRLNSACLHHRRVANLCHCQTLVKIGTATRLLPGHEPLYLMVGLDRLELSTSRLSGVRSNHLSYRPQRLFCKKGKIRESAAKNKNWLFASEE